MKINIQHHAVERFVQYYSPGVPDDEVVRAMLEMLNRAKHSKIKTSCGDFLWTCDGVRFVIKHDHGLKSTKWSKKGIYCVTVLPPLESGEVDAECIDPWGEDFRTLQEVSIEDDLSLSERVDLKTPKIPTETQELVNKYRLLRHGINNLESRRDKTIQDRGIAVNVIPNPARAECLTIELEDTLDQLSRLKTEAGAVKKELKKLGIINAAEHYI